MHPVQLFVARDELYAEKQGSGTIADMDEIELLVVGAFAFFTENGALITASTTAAQLKQVQKFYIGINTVNGPRLSVPIDRSAFNFTKQGYLAPVQQVTVVGESGGGNGSMNYPTLVAGDTASIVITDTTTSEFGPGGRVRRYEYVVKTGDTAAIVTAALIAAINADSDAKVTAAAITTVGITLTAKAGVKTFLVGVDGVASNATVWADGTNGSAYYNSGRGTVSHLLELENEDAIVQGRSNSGGQQQYWFKQTSDVVASGITQFEMWVFGHKTEVRPAGFVQNVTTVDTVLAYPVGTTATTGIEDVAAGILAVLMSEADSNSGASSESDN